MENAVAFALERARAALFDMGRDPETATVFAGTLDGLRAGEVAERLDAPADAEVLLVVGDWAKGNAVGTDTYDIAFGFAEDGYARIRACKSQDGWFAVVATDKLEVGE